MPKAASDYVLDGIPERIAEGDRLYICSDEPATYAGIAALALASAALVPGSGNGDFTIANGAVSGRRVTVAQQEDIPITATGEADHVVVADDANQRLLAVTVCTPLALTSGGTVTSPAWDAEVGDPT